jgi:hypothetical protein
MNNISSFGVMNSSVLLLTTAGELLSFGDNNVYQLGDGTNISPLKLTQQRTIVTGVLANKTIEKFFISNSQTLSFFVKGKVIIFKSLLDLTCFNISFNSSSVCNGNGSCTAIDICSCFNGYYGPYCLDYTCSGVFPSNSSVCSSHGNCTNANQCQCENNYFGKNCAVTTCNGKNSTDNLVCSAVGSCVSFNNCSCNAGYAGIDCQIKSCFGKNSSNPNVCSGNGNCSTPNNCSCAQGYVGNECQLSTCFGKNSTNSDVCSGKGNCTSPNNCKCERGYQGVTCEQRIVLWDLISSLCNEGCKLNKTFWENCTLNQGVSCYCNHSSNHVQINCSLNDVTHM